MKVLEMIMTAVEFKGGLDWLKTATILTSPKDNR